MSTFKTVIEAIEAESGKLIPVWVDLAGLFGIKNQVDSAIATHATAAQNAIDKGVITLDDLAKVASVVAPAAAPIVAVVETVADEAKTLVDGAVSDVESTATPAVATETIAQEPADEFANGKGEGLPGTDPAVATPTPTEAGYVPIVAATSEKQLWIAWPDDNENQDPTQDELVANYNTLNPPATAS